EVVAVLLAALLQLGPLFRQLPLAPGQLLLAAVEVVLALPAGGGDAAVLLLDEGPLAPDLFQGGLDGGLAQGQLLFLTGHVGGCAGAVVGVGPGAPGVLGGGPDRERADADAQLGAADAEDVAVVEVGGGDGPAVDEEGLDGGELADAGAGGEPADEAEDRGEVG